MEDASKWHIDIVESRTEKEANYINALIKKFSKNEQNYTKILDIPCGYGRHHRILRNLGYEVYGIDISKELIEKAKKMYPGYENNYLVGDMRTSSFNFKFDVIINWFSSFGYFDDKGNTKVIENFYKNLRNKGLLLMEMQNSDLTIKKLSEGIIVNEAMHNNIRETIINYQDPKDIRFYFVDEFFYKDNKLLEENKIRIRIYSINELKTLLKLHGFKLLSIYESLTFHKLHRRSKRATLIAIKT